MTLRLTSKKEIETFIVLKTDYNCVCGFSHSSFLGMAGVKIGLLPAT